MNERIRELAEQQAGSILMDLVMPDAGMPERVKWNVGCTTEHLKKFAELIVRECARLARDTDLEDVEGGDSSVLLAAKLNILNHFGY